MKKSAIRAMHAKKHGIIRAYDMKLKKEVEMLNPREVTMKNGRKAWKGISAESGINLFRIKGKND